MGAIVGVSGPEAGPLHDPPLVRPHADRAVALADLDGNETLDIVFASAVTHRGEPNRMCLGDGEGRFECRNVSGDLLDSSGVAVGQLTPPPAARR